MLLKVGTQVSNALKITLTNFHQHLSCSSQVFKGRYNKYFFQDPKNSLLSRFFVILVRLGVKTRDLDILWQEINFWLFVMLENEVPNSEQFLKPFFE